ncbi:MAG: polyphosphate kinase 1 [Leptospiraceae bacterium]|nr:polyphosphate kinase 1 [Leptospiraceae bacterium]
MNYEINIQNSEIFFDRELSWLDFNCRVLEEAADPSNPILERLKFLCITESNLDEFHMVRVANLRSKLSAGNDGRSLNGMRFSEIIQAVSSKVNEFIHKQYEIYTNSILPELKSNKINLIEDYTELTESEIELIKKYYKEEVSSILTPLSIDPAHPFPHILNKTLNLAITLSSQDENNKKKDIFAIVQVPSVLPRFWELPEQNGERRFFPLEGIIKLHLSDLFYGMLVKEIHAFKIIRDSDLSIAEDKVRDLLTSVKKELKNRIWGNTVKLYVHKSAHGQVKQYLQEMLDVQEHETCEIPHVLNLSDLMYFYNLNNTSKLKFPYIESRSVIQATSVTSLFHLIRKQDHLLHHPYDSFQGVEELLKASSEDPKVLAIKMTLYRTSGDSPLISYLQQAAENGKQVTVLVELKARFDEERNIIWAQKLEDSGVHVVYGIVGLKIHCKAMLIVRRESDKLRRYVHLSTGNYNSTTAKYYTDLSLLTENGEFTEAVGTLFNSLTSLAKIPRLNQLSVAPQYLKDDIINLIEKETANAQNGNEARIIMKMNSLVDPDVIIALYNASAAGVKIDLIVRGICCLVPGISGVSENIVVRSLVGRYLEHSRIYVFLNKGDWKMFLTSADCMPRNFYKRVELMFPITDKSIKEKILNVLDMILKDNVKTRILSSDGTYHKLFPREGEKVVNSQMELFNI